MAVGQGLRTTEDALRGLEISSRQVNHWVARGWVKPNGVTGSGYTNEYGQQELAILRKMAKLVHIGMRPEQAARVARIAVLNNVSMVTDTDTGVMIVFKES